MAGLIGGILGGVLVFAALSSNPQVPPPAFPQSVGETPTVEMSDQIAEVVARIGPSDEAGMRQRDILISIGGGAIDEKNPFIQCAFPVPSRGVGACSRIAGWPRTGSRRTAWGTPGVIGSGLAASDLPIWA